MNENKIRYYSGVGSRDTPQVILNDMKEIARVLRDAGYVLNSGGAGGADSAFEFGAGDLKQIFLPYDGFNGRRVDDVHFFMPDNPAAKKIAAKYHPNWNRCGFAAKRFHTRNSYQVLGMDLKTPVDFVICYTEGGLLKGGTAQAMRIAKDHDIPIFNLGRLSKNDVLYMLSDYLKSNEI